MVKTSAEQNADLGHLQHKKKVTFYWKVFFRLATGNDETEKKLREGFETPVKG